MRGLSFGVLLGVALLSACGKTPVEDQGADAAAANVSLRNLTETDVAVVPRHRDFPLKGHKVPTPSDTRSDYYLLRTRTAVTGNVIAILREERGDRVAYARTETDCGNRLMHVLGVGSTRADAEVAIVHDGPLRSIEGLPLRQELARTICETSGTPLRPA